MSAAIDEESGIRHRQVTAVSSVVKAQDLPNLDYAATPDEETLFALGYKQEFKREFSLWTTFCVSFAVLGLLPSFASTLYYGMGYAGTAGMVWGWIVAMVFIQCVAMSMAELCSSMPTSGGLYYAAAVLAPEGWGPFAAWVTGWSNWIVQVTAAPSVDYAMAAMILALGSMANENYHIESYHVFLLSTLIMLIHGVISSMPTLWIARFNSVGTVINIIALIVVIIIIPADTTRRNPRFNPSSQVWGEITNMTSYPSGVAVLMSFISVIWTMSGYDSPFHLAEECSNANVAAPRAIVLTSGIGGVMGWFLQLVVAYTVVDINDVIGSELGQPWAAYCLQVLPYNTSVAVISLTVVCAFSMGQGCMVAASRVTYAYARDDCFPLSQYWKRVHPVTKTPVMAVWFNCVIGILLLLLIFAGDLAIGAIFSVGAIAAFVSFTIPIFIRVFFVGDKFRRGPWHLGRFSRPIGIAACSFVVLMVPILCLPQYTGSELNAQDMNYTCLVYGGPMLAIIIWWFVDAKKWFHGPKINVEHKMLGAKGNVVDGVNIGVAVEPVDSDNDAPVKDFI
ncbi:putative amino-acid permease [Drechslerella stenobrocha 248]|uniref:Putative amino-acid permease n=1 Tax=Drechslerella stenobrocha 248 TaxID=1043628 RepID=W7I6K4_9PEZI|nr:putative amino-acid permease [Drechslerella stenobrocha 248]